jgi:dephospho-CoA kinase
MLRVGLTGGLGSGKTAAADIFESLGAHVIKADLIARDQMQPGTETFVNVVAHFGSGILTPTGEINRPVLAEIVFESADAAAELAALNAIVHPAVIEKQLQWLDDIAARDPHAVAIVESALIFESILGESTHAANRHFDRIVLVTAPEEIKIARFIARAHGNKQLSADGLQKLTSDARHRIARQLPDAEKASRSDYIIDNSGTHDALTEQVRNIYAQLAEETQHHS